jgi:hypothetical protein
MSAVVAMPVEIRFKEVLWRTLPLLPKELREEFLAFLSPASVAIMAGTLVAWSGSHAFGVGFIADGVMAVVGIAFLGVQFYASASDLAEAVTLTVEAGAPEDLDRAAAALARFVSVVGVAVTTALMLKIGRRAAVVAVSRTALLESGMTAEHFAAARKVAVREKRVIIMKNTNQRSTPLIAKEFPSKPMIVKAKTDAKTGIVTVESLPEKLEAYEAGYYVVDSQGVARKGGTLSISGADKGQLSLRWDEKPTWDLKPGQVIDPMTKKPLVGDYDLVGVFDPLVPRSNTALAFSNGEQAKHNITPEVKRVMQCLNDEMKSMRVLHGAHDQWLKGGDLNDIKGATVFYPNGAVRSLTTSELKQFYEKIGRISLFDSVAPVNSGVTSPEHLSSKIIPINRGRK